MRILVCGGRDFLDEDFLCEVLEEIQPDEIISGMARGADSFAANYAEKASIDLLKFPANWTKYGKAAGPIRNQQMLDEGKPDLVIAFHGPPPIDGRKTGTMDMVERAEKAGVKVKEYKHK